jgi:glutamate---cysteine ligase / carboxylate-amine ligase
MLLEAAWGSVFFKRCGDGIGLGADRISVSPRRPLPRTDMPFARSRLPFTRCPSFSLGLEEELLLVAPSSLRPRRGTDAVLAAVCPENGTVTGEVSDGVLELATPVCATAAQAVGVLGQLRAEVPSGVRLLGAGVHPLGRFGEVTIRPGERYALIAGTMSALMRQTPHCGVHVHVGMPDAETAVRAANGLRAWVPLLRALGANSPYWYGRDSGLATTRSVICDSFPRSGTPREFADYEDYAATVEELQALGECPDYSFLWWDVRPHPRLGTLEIRALDAQSSLYDLAGLVALIHCLAVHAASAPARRGPSPEVLRELNFRATRDGLDARLPLDGRLRPAREIAWHAVALAGAYAADLGCWDELLLLHRLLEDGNGADRQRRNAREGGIQLLLRRLAEETSRGRPDTGPAHDVNVTRDALRVAA